MQSKTVLLLLALSISCSGCFGGEPCIWHDLEVRVFTNPVAGPAPFETVAIAYGEGFYCGCCGGKDSTKIVRYDWDIDGDGYIDTGGKKLDSVGIVFEKPGEHEVWVRVRDNADDMATATWTVIVE
jgi:hypothetical protein